MAEMPPASEEFSTNSIGTALSKAIFTVRERFALDESITSERFVNILAELNNKMATSEKLLQRINFVEGELRCDDLLARMELIRASLEGVSGADDYDDRDEKELLATADEHPLQGNSAATVPGVILANGSHFLGAGASSESTALDPWRRTISQLSMTSILEPEITCRVEVEMGPLEGSIFDRHRTYQVTVSSQMERVTRRYRDFDWLHGTLVHKYPFRVIPHLPGKGSLTDHWGVSSAEFMASRRRGLEEFLFLLLNHPVLQKEPLLIEFLSVRDFEEVRTRINSSWQEEFAMASQVEGENGNGIAQASTAITNGLVADPDWRPYEDAQEWAQQLRGSLLSLRQTLSALQGHSEALAGRLTIVAQCISGLLANSQHGEGTAGTVSKVFSSLSSPHARMADIFRRDSLRLELFIRLIISFQEMINRTRKLKYDRFAWLSDQIVSAQATTEKLRARDGSIGAATSSAELERALNRVSQYQRDLLYQSRRNQFADACLRHEVGWAVKMYRSLPALFTEAQSSLHQQYQVASELTNN